MARDGSPSAHIGPENDARTTSGPIQLLEKRTVAGPSK